MNDRALVPGSYESISPLYNLLKTFISMTGINKSVGYGPLQSVMNGVSTTDVGYGPLQSVWNGISTTSVGYGPLPSHSDGAISCTIL